MQKKQEKQAREILRRAQERGLENNFFFTTTFERYLTQVRIMEDLEREISESGTTVTKEYVKGRANIYTNPAIAEYNKTATAANGTVSTLIKIIDSFKGDEKQASKLQQLMAAINGEDDAGGPVE